jgi:hypothetical protein
MLSMLQAVAEWFGSRKAQQTSKRGCRRRAASASRRRPELERLEDRLAPAAVPVIAVSAPATPFLGACHIPVSITFSNPSASGATNPGYAPWDYAIIPNVAPTDGDVGEGLSFDPSVTPNFLGAAVTFQESTVPAGGTVTGPAIR